MPYGRQIRPWEYTLPQMHLASQRQGMQQPQGSIATTEQPEQRQQPPQMPMGLLGEALKKPGAPVYQLPGFEQMWGEQIAQAFGPSGFEAAAASQPGIEAFSTPYLDAAAGGNLGFGGEVAGASMVPDFSMAFAPEAGAMGAEAGMLGASGAEAAAGVMPAMEVASAAPLAEAGMAAGAAEGAAAAAAAEGAAASGGLLGGLGGLSVLGPLAGLGILGYLAIENDWF